MHKMSTADTFPGMLRRVALLVGVLAVIASSSGHVALASSEGESEMIAEDVDLTVHACASICFSVNGAGTSGASARRQRASGSASVSHAGAAESVVAGTVDDAADDARAPVEFTGALRNEVIPNSAVAQPRQPAVGTATADAAADAAAVAARAAAAATDVVCRRRNMPQLPCDRAWPLRVCCTIVPARLPHGSKLMSLKWDCAVGIAPAVTAAHGVFGEDATVTCTNASGGALPLPGAAHLRTRRADVQWSAFAQRMHDAETALADAAHGTTALMVARDEATNDGNCFRWLRRRGETCTVTISMRNHDRSLVTVSLFLMIAVLAGVLLSVCCRKRTPGRRSAAVTNALDEMEHAALARAFAMAGSGGKPPSAAAAVAAGPGAGGGARAAGASSAATPSQIAQSHETRIDTESYPIDEIVFPVSSNSNRSQHRARLES